MEKLTKFSVLLLVLILISCGRMSLNAIEKGENLAQKEEFQEKCPNESYFDRNAMLLTFEKGNTIFSVLALTNLSEFSQITGTSWLLYELAQELFQNNWENVTEFDLSFFSSNMVIIECESRKLYKGQISKAPFIQVTYGMDDQYLAVPIHGRNQISGKYYSFKEMISIAVENITLQMNNQHLYEVARGLSAGNN